MYLGIDIGGSKTILAVFDEDGAIVSQSRLPTPKVYQDFVNDLSEKIKNLEYHQTIVASALAVPGRIDYQQGVGISFGTLPWQNVALRHDLKAFMPWPITLEHDVQAAALSEAALLETKYDCILYLTISNGIGAAVIIDGVIDRTTLHSEVGSIVFPYQDSLVRWENFASGRSIVERFGQRLRSIKDEDALQVIGENIAIGVIACCAHVQPNAVIFGGGAGGYLTKCLKYMETFLDRHLYPTIKRPQLLIAHYPETAALRGCFMVAKQISQRAKSA